MAAHGIYGYFGDDAAYLDGDPLVDEEPPRLGGATRTRSLPRMAW